MTSWLFTILRRVSELQGVWVCFGSELSPPEARYRRRGEHPEPLAVEIGRARPVSAPPRSIPAIRAFLCARTPLSLLALFVNGRLRPEGRKRRGRFYYRSLPPSRFSRAAILCCPSLRRTTPTIYIEVLPPRPPMTRF
ncbi:hypothetical protein EVAR_53802_1 [Eumeta japonica]|uniref:Uncharacterized protein n=1 Tax=Eumeta variegata TaxID=151549 RepID=A0A4C1XWA9_EUMVA|nr:hypothetical protein EVAR_53802_1 [Eumeta japonica]